MNRNAKKVSRAVLVATLVVTVGAASFSGLKAETPQSSHREQTARNGNVHPRTKLGKAYSHLFSFHNPGANDGRVQGFAKATDLTDEGWAMGWGNRKPPYAASGERAGIERRSKAAWNQMPSQQATNRRTEEQHPGKIEAKTANRFC